MDRTEEIAIREATEADVPDLVEMLHHLDAHVSGVPREELQMTDSGQQALQKRLRSLIEVGDGLVLIARNTDDDPVAMATIGVWHGDAGWVNPERRNHVTAIIDDVWVDPSCRRQGLSQKMLIHMLAFAESRGAAELVLEYSLSNPEADATWRRLGFEPTGVRAAASTCTVRSALEGGTGKRRRQ